MTATTTADRTPPTTPTPGGASKRPWLATMIDADPDAPIRAYPNQPALLGPIHAEEYRRCVEAERRRVWRVTAA